ncbi:N-acetylmuramoyl-L-alanine amidase [Pedobacter sp. ASV28]|uniref:N-acetylmuramoyl-L-alanine amidase n=1 Tax=Pedobacter sp. ASV28 TaxID=2795123 RepID=UPI0018EA5337|nr:N-acetylmuramoyl-L-alanine amidase [Pedobacter sp. ASV28]
MKILLDNGHGAETPGKRSPVWPNGKQLLEWKFNREMVALIAAELQQLDIEHQVIVPETTDVSLAERANRANVYYSKGIKCILVSVHANAGGGTGWEVFHYPSSEVSKAYAQIFAQVASKALPEFKNRGVKSENFQILRQAKCPSVLTENLFMDTWKDCEFILSQEGKERIAKLHVTAIQQIIKNG